MPPAQPKVHRAEIKHGDHTYLLFWTKETLDQAVRVPGRQLVDPELNFDSLDGLKLATAIQDKTHTSIKTQAFTR
jgi:hypothetical protein